MIRPFTCICLVLAAGSGLYLYQVKQRAFALDAQLRGTFHDIDLARERTRMLRADWALMNDPERLQSLADQYLALKPMGPSQLMTLDQLASALPPPLPAGAAPATDNPDGTAAPLANDPTRGVPMASATPPASPAGGPAAPAVAMLQPTPAAPSDQPKVPGATAAAAAASAALALASPTLAAPDAVDITPAPLPADPAPTLAPAKILPKLASASAPAAAKPVHHAVKRTAPTPAPQPWLADATGSGPAVTATPAVVAQKPHRNTHHHVTPPSDGTQFYAANEPARQPYAAPRITPPAATVMYSPTSGSSLGMASSATLAPPRPLYPTSQ